MKKSVSDLAVVSLIGATVIAVFIGFGGTNRNYTMKTLGNNIAYTMRIDSTNTFSNSTGVIDASGYIASGYGRNVKTANHNDILFTTNGIDNTLVFGGNYKNFFGNYTPLNGLKNITVVGAGSYSISYGYSYGYYDVQKETLSSGLKYDFDGNMPTYFAVYNQGGSVNQIDYVEIEFSCAEESTPFNNNYLKYTYSSDKGGYVCSVNPDSYYPCMKGDINIPSNYNDGVNGSYPVVEIANETFMKNNAPNVTGVYFPNSIKKYGDYLFRFNTSLTNVQLSTGATNIAPYMFDGCTNLQAVVIPNTVTSISDYAFNECRSITNLVIPNSVTQISNTGTFTSMSGLKSITWPSGITQIGPCYGGSGLETLTIPDSVTTIKYSAFVGSTLLETLTLGQNVTSIEWNAFDGCTSLQSINFNDDLQLIYQYAFSSCSSLEELVFPNSLTTIGHHAFYQCSSLTSVVIPVSVVDINDNVFNKCTNLSYVEYKGTSSQWRSIQFHGFTNQFDNTGVTVIHCSDGDITPFPTE